MHVVDSAQRLIVAGQPVMVPAMRHVTLLALLMAAASACGGRLAAIGGDPTAPDDAAEDTSTIADAAAFQDAGTIDAPEEPPMVDAAYDASPAVACPSATGQSSGCPDGAYCVIWLTADASLASAGHLPDADILEWACETGSPATLCSGSAPVETYYSPYSNRLIWAVCAGQ
jgi:hypothetical protein